MNTRAHKRRIKELNQFLGWVCPEIIAERLKTEVMGAEENYSAHVAVAPSNFRVKLPAAGFGPGLKPLVPR